MYHHVKKVIFTAGVAEADPRFGNMLEQFGGASAILLTESKVTSRRTKSRAKPRR